MTQPLATLVLHHLEGARAGQTESYTQPVLVIGRAPDCHLVFDQEKGVSGRHCEIRQSEGRFELVDNNSTNGLFVGEERVTRRELRDGDLIRFGMMGPLVRVELPRPQSATVAMPLPQAAPSTVVMPALSQPPVSPAAPVSAPPPRPAAARAAVPATAAPPSPGPGAAGSAAPVRSARSAAAAGPPAAQGGGMVWRWLIAILVVVMLGGGAAVLAWVFLR